MARQPALRSSPHHLVNRSKEAHPPMKRIATVLALAALSVLPAACGTEPAKSPTTSGELKKVTFTLNWVPYGEHAPFYYGLKKGFYKDEGIDLTIKPGNGSGATVQQGNQKNTDFGWSDTPPMLKSITSGMKVKSVGVFLQKGPGSIESLADKNINSPADLKGKSIGGTPDDALYSTFPACLKANGHGPTIEGKTGKKFNYILYADSGLNMLGTGIVVHEDTLKKDADLVRRFVRATQKSWAEAVKDIPGAVSAMAEQVQNAPPATVLTKQLTLAVPLLQLEKAGAPGVNSETDWSGTIDLMAKYADLKSPGPASKYWDSSFANKG